MTAPATQISQVMFSVEVQESLMACPWPQELLCMEDCRPVWGCAMPDRSLAQHVDRHQLQGQCQAQSRRGWCCSALVSEHLASCICIH